MSAVANGADASRPRRALPPGQHLIRSFPRYGTHLWRPVPDLADRPLLRVQGVVSSPVDVPIASLASMPRAEITADFHCVAGWSVQNLRWQGVAFSVFFEHLIAPIAPPRSTHLRFIGVDGFRSVLPLDDALEDDALLADHLAGVPLPLEHGGPVRFVAPGRYGYKSTKHLAAIEVHTSEPREGHEDWFLNSVLRLIKPHPRARVTEEERHRHLPGAAVRWPYSNVLHPFFRTLCKIGDRQGRDR